MIVPLCVAVTLDAHVRTRAPGWRGRANQSVQPGVATQRERQSPRALSAGRSLGWRAPSANESTLLHLILLLIPRTSRVFGP